MESSPTPDQVRRARFRAVFRGVDSGEVEAFLESVATGIEALATERDRLMERLGELAERDLATEFESVGREVAAVLQAAREAADAMRERAGADAARWRAEATAEAEDAIKRARSDAEHLRGDAWTTGTELLNQVMAEVRRLRENAEREVLSIVGEAEREAHRLTAIARRDAEELSRNSRVEAERLTVEAQTRHDEILEQAQRQAESAQERARALEARRDELLEELDLVRSTLSRLEGDLDGRRDDLGFRSGDSSVKIVPPASLPPSPPKTWEPGETVRVVRPSSDEPEKPPKEPEEPPEEDGPDAETIAEDVRRLRRAPQPEPGVEVEESPGPTEVVLAEETTPDEQTKESTGGSIADDLSSLFARLRVPVRSRQANETTMERSVEEVSPEDSPSDEPPSGETAAAAGQDVRPMVSDPNAIAARDGAILPITNRALRNLKRSLTEAQNLALEGVRLDPDAWRPDPETLADSLRPDLVTLFAESYAAGHVSARETLGETVKRPPTPKRDDAEAVAAALAAALDETGTGDARDRQAAVSRVFRSWRTDEAERRVRALGLTAFHLGLAQSAPALEWVAAGRPCSACQGAASDPTSNLPPVHLGCECTVVAVSP